MKTVSTAYIDGIREGREVFSQHRYLCPKIEHESFKNLALSHSGAMKDFYKGQRDFWKNQIKKEQ